SASCEQLRDLGGQIEDPLSARARDRRGELRNVFELPAEAAGGVVAQRNLHRLIGGHHPYPPSVELDDAGEGGGGDDRAAGELVELQCPACEFPCEAGVV